MATELRTLTWCDVHQQEKDEQEPGHCYEIGGRQVDLCNECAGPFLAAAQLAAEYGRKPRRSHRAKTEEKPADLVSPVDPLVCPECGKGPYVHLQSLSSHARAAHGMSRAQILGKETPYTCSQRGCGRVFSTPQGLALHERSHGSDAESG
jgi:hypothetical protein